MTIFLGIVLVATTLAQLTWRVLYHPPATLAVANPVAVVRSNGVTTSSASNPSLLQLFGGATLQSGPGGSAPETSLDLTLRGIIFLGNKRALAIIAHGDSELPYKIGDTLPGGALINDILVESVILDRGGRFESLSLPAKANGSNYETPGASTMPAAAAGRMPANGGHFSDLQKRLHSSSAKRDMSGAQADIAGGQPQGYRVGDNAYMPVLRNSGLKPGDVITRINGKPANAKINEAELLNQIASSGHATIEVMRDGAPLTLTVDLRK